MRTAFVTSGFPDGFTSEFLGKINEHMKLPASLAFVASDFAAHEKTLRYMKLFSDMLKEGGIIIREVHAVDFSLSPEECAEVVAGADIVWLSGGNTLTQIEHIKGYRLTEPLLSRDGVTIGMSAGAINMARRVVLARDPDDGIPELAVYDGIGLVDFNIEPHLNNASEEHIADIRFASRVAPIYGLYDGAFILYETPAGSITGTPEKYSGIIKSPPVIQTGHIKIYGNYRLFSGGECPEKTDTAKGTV